MQMKKRKKYDLNDKLYVFIDEYIEYYMNSKIIEDLMKLISTHMPSLIEDKSMFNYAICLRTFRCERIWFADIFTFNFDIGEFIIVGIKNKQIIDKIKDINSILIEWYGINI